MIKHANNLQEFNELTQGQTVVVDFFATWCGPCRMLSPVIEDVDKENLLGIDFVKVDVDEVPEAAAKFGVSSIPTLIIFKEGKAVDQLLGYRPKAQLVEDIKKSIE